MLRPTLEVPDSGVVLPRRRPAHQAGGEEALTTRTDVAVVLDSLHEETGGGARHVVRAHRDVTDHRIVSAPPIIGSFRPCSRAQSIAMS